MADNGRQPPKRKWSHGSPLDNDPEDFGPGINPLVRRASNATITRSGPRAAGPRAAGAAVGALALPSETIGVLQPAVSARSTLACIAAFANKSPAPAQSALIMMRSELKMADDAAVGAIISTRLWPELAAEYPSTISWLNNESPEKIAAARLRDKSPLRCVYEKNER